MLVVRDTGYGSGNFLHSKEGVTQGDPLSMIAYGIGILPLIRELQNAHPRVTQSWYDDDAGAGGDVPAGTDALLESVSACPISAIYAMRVLWEC